MARFSSLVIVDMLIVLLFIALILAILWVVKVWQEEKAKVLNMPKVPMSLCDKHGAFPSSMMLKMTVPADNRQDLIVEQCPQCYSDKLKESKRIPA